MSDKQVLEHEKKIVEYEKTLSHFKEQNRENSLYSEEEMEQLELKLASLKESVYSRLTPWERVTICRHPARPRTIDYIRNMCEQFVELSGDRLFRDDPAIVTGFAKIGGKKFLVVGQEKGCDTESRLHRNFGMPYPEGFRKAMRCMRLAEKSKLPILCLLDTPGAYAGLAAEERGQGWAIAQNLFEMARLATPIITIVIGEGCSGGALGIGVGDRVAMLEHSYYSVISPEACASILWRDAGKKELAASILKMQAENLLELGIIDAVIQEPLGGAHHNTQELYTNVKKYILEQWKELQLLPLDEVLKKRYQKFRRLGRYETAP